MQYVRSDIDNLLAALEENTRVTNFMRTELEENTELCRKIYAKLDGIEQSDWKAFGLDLAANLTAFALVDRK